MSWQTTLGHTWANCADFLEDATDGLYKKMTDAGWTLHDDRVATSGQTDKVFKSTGEDGSETIFIRITQTNGTQRARFGTYTYWDAIGHAGHNEVRGGLSYGGHTDLPNCFDTLSTNFVGWIAANKDGVSFCHKLSTRYSMCYFGLVKTRQSPASQSGRTTLTSGVTIAASGSTVLSVASESNIATGQKVWVINQDTTAGGTMCRCTVTGTATGQVTVTNDSGVATAFDTGALVGADPQPIVLPTCNVDSGYYRGVPQKSYSTLYKSSDTRKTGSAQSESNVPRFAIFMPNADTIATTANDNSTPYPNPNNSHLINRNNPDGWGRMTIYPYMLYDGWTHDQNPVSSGIIRGSTDRVCWAPKGVILANEDTISIAGSTAQWIVMDTLSALGTFGMGDVTLTAMKIAE